MDTSGKNSQMQEQQTIQEFLAKSCFLHKLNLFKGSPNQHLQ